MYKKVDTTLNFLDREKEVLQFWKDNKIFEKNVQENEGSREFTFYDGPPTANGKPHIGHSLTRVIKDIIPRYHVMKGDHCLRKAGWDTHGLPVELEVEKLLGIDGKQEIEKQLNYFFDVQKKFDNLSNIGELTNDDFKRIVAAVVALLFCIPLISCTSPSDIYGAWYVDEDGVRNAIQFSENAEGKDVFIWAVYNIEEDIVESNNKGYYKISGDQIIFEYGDDTENFQLEFVLEGDKLTIFNETARLTLTKYVLE